MLRVLPGELVSELSRYKGEETRNKPGIKLN
jgi:hypothetical protein